MDFAVLLTCYNRKAKTKHCLEKLFDQKLPLGSFMTVILCDDASSDGTNELVKQSFPQVVVVQGTGSLFWNGGMNLAWNTAKKLKDFDFFIWLNDDTYLLANAVKKIFEEFYSLEKPGVLTAACKIPGTKEFSYGGWSGFGPILPNKNIQEAALISGNFVLIPKKIVDKIGTLSSKYTHYLGDFDYGLRAIKAGFNCYTTSQYLAECGTNSLPYWGDKKFAFKVRWKLLHDVKGQAFKEYLYFKFKHYGFIVGLKTVLDTYLKVLSPKIYVGVRNGFREEILKKKEEQ